MAVSLFSMTNWRPLEIDRHFISFVNRHFRGEKGQTFDRPGFSNVKEWLISVITEQ